MKLILLAPLALLVTTPGQSGVNIFPGSGSNMPPAGWVDDKPAPSASFETLLGEWAALEGNIYCKGLTFYSGGGLDIRTEKKRLSAFYEVREKTAKSISGQFLARRPAGDSPARPFTIKFLSASKIELTLHYRDGEYRKAVLEKRRDFRAGAWLID